MSRSRFRFSSLWFRLYLGFPVGVFAVVVISFMAGWGFGIFQTVDAVCYQFHFSSCGPFGHLFHH